MHALRFIRNARDLGFPLAEIEELLGLWRDRARASAEVKRLALAHIAAVEEKVKALQAVRESLLHLAKACSGDRRPECPILNGIYQRQMVAAPIAGRRARSVEGLRHTGI